MIISVWDTEWKKIRDKFNEQEKEQLEKSIVSQSICPPGVQVELDKLDKNLGIKLKKLVHPLSN